MVELEAADVEGKHEAVEAADRSCFSGEMVEVMSG